jgi:hypothetical protein
MIIKIQLFFSAFFGVFFVSRCKSRIFKKKMQKYFQKKSMLSTFLKSKKTSKHYAQKSIFKVFPETIFGFSFLDIFKMSKIEFQKKVLGK